MIKVAVLFPKFVEGKGTKGKGALMVSRKNSPEGCATARKLWRVDKTSSPSEALNIRAANKNKTLKS